MSRGKRRAQDPAPETAPDPTQDPGGDPVADQGGDPGTEVVDPAAGTEQRSILANTAVMAAGTVVSRLSGFVRNALLAAALGVSLHADIFTVANTLPNMLYILLAGGVFNAVLVPQLVRSMQNDPDGGAAYINRVMTLAGLFLAGVTVLLVVAAPWVMSLLLSSQYDEPALAEARSSAIDFARYCLPQVFFYGMFVLIGQVLNARGRFGPMMWAPIANNVISVGVLVAYLFVFGAATPAEQEGPFTPGQELLLGLGSTAGIAAQLLILVPYLRSAGVRYRPRFDFRGVGLGHTMRLGIWTVLFVIVNQIAYVVVVKLASGGTASSDAGTGITIYSSVMLVVMVPHSIITVSLATAILPRLSAAAAEDDPGRLGATLGSTLRTALAVVVPFAALLPAVAMPVSQVIWGHGATADRYDRFETSMILFGVGVVAFTVHYLVLRGFYALELTRLVFFVQCAIAATNIVLATVLVRSNDAAQTAPMLVLAYTGAYAVGSVISAAVLVRRLRRAGAPAADVREWVGFVARLLAAAAVVGGVGLLLELVVRDTLAELGTDSWWWSLVELGIVGTGAGGAFLAAASMLRLREVTSVLGLVQSRLRRR
ncbi:murein biosynthesis integral membrane protein MurJ [Nocardioides sp. zg-ZUI104]|uniref:murein biosynthesis integral membrane protein MurJ n=1 Tax=Nocardioides faecalis TaxID=2803858 RepID=UPI001BCB57B6|nr:murein biosynthesis integral membrane protein MurJ [Nocardioides faecalis]MBS4753177.1 murein biosynthesis integral membrane protein MurJ [Nocardioides faecalis]